MFKRNICLLCVVLVAAFICFGIASAAELGLVAHWPLDGDAKDITGNGNDGTVTGAVNWVEGFSRKAAEFTGGSIDCGNKEILAPSPMSCMFWMKPLKDYGPDDVRMNVVYYACGPMFALNPNHWDADLHAKRPLGSIMAWICGPEPEVGTAAWTKKHTKWTAGTWYHLAMVYDEKSLVIYVDGEEEDRAVAAGPIKPRKNNFLIGSKEYTGVVDEVKLYDRALAASEVRGFVTALEPQDSLTSTWGDIKSN